MQNLFLGFIMSALISSPQTILGQISDPGITYKAIRVDHGVTILLTHGDHSYTVYASRCNELVKDLQKLDYIILNPGEPVELIDNSKNVLILYSLPCE